MKNAYPYANGFGSLDFDASTKSSNSHGKGFKKENIENIRNRMG